MRVTNAMTTNQLLLNLNKNMTAMSLLQYQAETGNKIRYASDDPIVAGRALKFRTNIVETDQYLSNVDQGKSWLQTSANAVSNIMQAMVNSGETSIRSLLVSASNGTNTIDDAKIFSSQIRETLAEIKSELNTSYAGRYVFSGFKTDEKPVLDVDQPGASYRINESFSFDEIDPNYRVYVKTDKLIPVDQNYNPTSKPAMTMDNEAMPQEIACHRLKLAYDIDVTALQGLTPAPIAKNSQVDADAYIPADGEIYFVEDTGELIFGKTVYNNIQTELGTKKAAADAATKSGIDAVVAASKNTDPAGQAAALTAITDLQTKAGGLLTANAGGILNSDSYNLLTDAKSATDAAVTAANTLIAAQTALDADPENTALLKARNEAMSKARDTAKTAQEQVTRAAEATQSVEISYTKTGLAKNDINPRVYFECTDNSTNKKYEMNNQEMMYEFGINNKLQINTLAKDLLKTDTMNDINDVIRLVDSIKVSDKTELVAKYQADGFSLEEAEAKANEQITNEEKFYVDLITKKYTQLIGKVDGHSTSISKENTNVGSKLNRLELVSSRLQDDRVNYEDLKANNENVDMAEAYIRYQSMSSVYQSSLQIGSKIIQMTLVNFI